jgi:glutamyl-tRNA reductase
MPFEHRLYSYFGIDCMAHLCRVTAGLDSALIAETEIQRQVKLAYAKAAESISLPSCLHFLFQKALKVGKSVRHAMGPAEKAPTLFNQLWHLADWKNKKILLVGHSQINRGFASFLLFKGISHFALCTKNPWRVLLEGVRVYDRKILERWQEFDLVVCASQAEDYLIRGHGEKRHTLFDLSVPRNIDPAVGQISRLYNIDQLGASKGNPQPLERWENLLMDNVGRLYYCYSKKVHGYGFALSAQSGVSIACHAQLS